MASSPSSTVQLARLTIQHDLPEVLTEIQQGLHAAEDCWISAYLANESVHAKLRLSEVEGGGAIEAEGLEGVSARLVSQTELSISCDKLAVPPTAVHFPSTASVGTPLRAHGGIAVLAVSPNGDRFVVGGDDGLCRVGSTRKSGGEIALKGHVGDIRAAAFFPSNEVVLTASSDMSLRVWSATDGTNPRTLSGHTKAVTSLSILAVGRTVLSGSLDGTLRLWLLAKPELLHSFYLTQPVYSLTTAPAPSSLQSELSSAEASEDGTAGLIALAGLQDGSVAVVDLTSRAKEARVLRTLKLGWSGIEAVAYDAKTGWVAAGARDGTVGLFTLSALPPAAAATEPVPPLLKFARGGPSITSLAFSSLPALSKEVQPPQGESTTLLIATSDGLPYRVSVAKEGGELGRPTVSVVEEFAGVDCDRTVMTEVGREVWIGAADGKLRRYL